MEPAGRDARRPAAQGQAVLLRRLRRLLQHGDQRAVRDRADDGPAQRRLQRADGADPRSADGPAVPGQHHSGQPLRSAGEEDPRHGLSGAEQRVAGARSRATVRSTTTRGACRRRATPTSGTCASTTTCPNKDRFFAPLQLQPGLQLQGADHAGPRRHRRAGRRPPVRTQPGVRHQLEPHPVAVGGQRVPRRLQQDRGRLLARHGRRSRPAPTFGFRGLPSFLDDVGGLPRITITGYQSVGVGNFRPQYPQPVLAPDHQRDDRRPRLADLEVRRRLPLQARQVGGPAVPDRRLQLRCAVHQRRHRRLPARQRPEPGRLELLRRQPGDAEPLGLLPERLEDSPESDASTSACATNTRRRSTAPASSRTRTSTSPRNSW